MKSSIKEMKEKTITAVHVLNGLNFGGVEVNCLNVLKHVPENSRNILVNLDPVVVDMLDQFKSIPNLEIVDINCHKGHRLNFVIRMALLLIKREPDIIINHPFGVHIYSALAGRLAVVPVIKVLAGNPPPDDQSTRRKIKIILFISRLLGVNVYSCSRYVHEKFSNLAKLPAGSHPVFYGCDIKAIQEKAYANHQRRTNFSEKIIGMVARLNKIKDHRTLIKAFKKVFDKNSDTRLWIIGEGEEKGMLIKLVNELKLSGSVVFLGNCSNISERLGAMDVFTFSTTQDEGFGIALIEAMAAGLPIVASDVPACREVLDGVGILVPEGDIDALAQAIEKLLNSPEKRTKLGEAAYKRVENLYGIKRAVEEYYSIGQ